MDTLQTKVAALIRQTEQEQIVEHLQKINELILTEYMLQIDDYLRHLSNMPKHY
jgi:hypothetical protein